MIVESMGVYLPPRSVTTEEITRGCKKPLSFPLEKMTGIHTRRMAGDTEFSIDLARRAIDECLALSRHTADDIDLLICCNISRVDGPDHKTTFEPSTAIRLRDHFKLKNAIVFDVSNACAGVFTGMVMAEGYLRTGAARRALVVSGEYITHLTKTAQQEIDNFMDPRIACLTVGDSGVALLLEPTTDPKVGFQALSLYTLGQYHTYCVAKPTDQEHGGAIMVTDPIKSSAIAINQAVEHSTEVLRKANWPIETASHLIMHQTSSTALNGAAREINQRFGKNALAPEKVVNNIAERANTATTTHWVAVMDQILTNKINQGDRVIFGVSGSGQITGTALYVFDDLPDRIRAKTKSRTGSEVRVTEQATAVRVRIESVGTAGDDVPRTSIPLAKSAAEDCLSRSGHERGDIDLLLFAGVYRDDFICEPAIAAMLAGELKINDDVEAVKKRKTFALDVFNGGIGFLNACHAATKRIQAGLTGRAMVVASEIENNAPRGAPVRRGVRETGSAMILDAEGDGKTGFGRFHFHYDTQHLADVQAHTIFADGKTTLGVELKPDRDRHLIATIVQGVHALLKQEGIGLDRIKAIFPPQVSPDFVGDLAKALDVPCERMIDVSLAGEDLFTSALPFALRKAQEEKRVQPGDIGLLIAAGAGNQVGCAIYYF